MAIPILVQPSNILQGVNNGANAIQNLLQTRNMPMQIKNQNALAAANAQIAQNTANYGDGAMNNLLVALNNPNVPEDQKAALRTGLMMQALYRPGMPSNPVSESLRAGAISQDPNASATVQAGSGQTPQELNALQTQQYQSKTAKQQAQASQAQQRADVLIPSQAKANDARANYYTQGGAKGTFLANLIAGKYGNGQGGSGTVSPDMVNQAIVGQLLTGVPIEVKRTYAYDAAQNDPRLQQNIEGANVKATSNQMLLRQQAAMEQFDSAVQPMMQKVGDAVSYYSGTKGAAQLRADQATYLATGKASPQYVDYLTTMQSNIPLIADNARKILGAQASDAMNEQLQGIVGPGDKANLKTLALMPPATVYQKLNDFSNYLKREVAVGRNFIGPTSLEKITPYKGYDASEVQDLMKRTGMNFNQAKSFIDKQGAQ